MLFKVNFTFSYNVISLDDLDRTRVIKVEVEKCKSNKHFIGGYKNKLDGTVYHNAEMQSEDFNKPPVVHVLKYHRDAQTYTYRTCSTTTMKDNETQMV